MIEEQYLSEKHTGMRCSLEDLLSQSRRLLRLSPEGKPYAFMLDELEMHLKVLALKFYAGQISVVDEFLQLYSFDGTRPKKD